MSAARPPIYVLDDLRVDLARQRVTRAQAELDVAGLSFQLLRYLLEQGDRVVGFDELIERVWAPAVVNEETVTQRIKLLRQALGDDGRNPRYVRSVRGRGYQLCSAPQRLEAETVAAAPPRRRAYAIGILGVATLLAALAVALHRPVAPAAPANARDELLQRARYYAGIGQADNNERAIALYEEALRAAPDDAAASVGLSRALSARMCLYNGAPDAAARAQALAEAVIARTPGDSAAHNALAYAHDCRGEIDAAIAEYERAFALDPSARADSRASAANLYAIRGRLAEALESNVAAERSGANLRFLDLQIARNLELLGFDAAAERRYAKIFRLYPDNVFGNVAWPRFLFVQGRYAEAEAALAEALDRPRHPQLFLLAGELALVRGNRPRAAEGFGEAVALRPHQSFPTTLARLHGVPAATPDELAERAAAVAESAADLPDAWIEVALLRSGAGDRVAAVAALGRAVDGGFRDQAWLRTSPLFRPLADEPGFAEVVDRIGRALASERATVLAAAWLPPELIEPKSHD
ncbi:winged helix-turn-helix domain-containing protein [Dokdonella sp.]|uniref:winged helix-turn-helix domain-containing protein n=1 Tax=Dokdonella sp. TaxID=2291710 RepID=UPI001B05E31A|nr:winged helix-turn-helix domain-containing protein [Dokdonella sp.]MBO9661659.1 winged helix-turn-helix domain-containing protein [Dokdonella sp.]